MWYTPIAVFSVLIVGVIVSYLTHPLKSNEVDPKLLISIGDVCCCCFPKRIRGWLRFGVDYDDYYEEQVNNYLVVLLLSKYDFSCRNVIMILK